MSGSFLLLLLCGLVQSVIAYPNGLVTPACVTMTPQHRAEQPSNTTAPYTVTANAQSYIAGQELTVTLQANDTIFRGFLLQARDETGPVGTFTVLGNETQLLTCGTINSSVSHSSRANRSTVVVRWRAPNSNNKDIQFRATFVQSFSVFWVGVQSELVRFTGANATTTIAPNTTIATNSTFTPNTTFATIPTTAINTTITANTIYTTPNTSTTMSLTFVLFLLPLLVTVSDV